jgi:hypothetical protein
LSHCVVQAVLKLTNLLLPSFCWRYATSNKSKIFASLLQLNKFIFTLLWEHKIKGRERYFCKIKGRETSVDHTMI